MRLFCVAYQALPRALQEEQVARKGIDPDANAAAISLKAAKRPMASLSDVTHFRKQHQSKNASITISDDISM